METVFIYGLWDPRNLELRYIGKSKNPKQRLKGHLAEARSKLNKSYKDRWIAQLLREGLRPSLDVLEEVAIDKWEQAERAWIAESKKHGLRLTNVCEGGESGPVLTEEQEQKRLEAVRKRLVGRKLTKEERQKLSEAHKGQRLTEETKRKLSEAHKGKNTWSKGRKMSPETIAKMRTTNKGKSRRMSEEAKKRLSEARTGEKNPMYGIPRSDETRQIMSQKLKGRIISEEHRAKLSESGKRDWIKRKESGFTLNTEQRKKIGDALRGRKKSPETIERMRLAQLKRRGCNE